MVSFVTLREGRVSRNYQSVSAIAVLLVTLREGRVSRNEELAAAAGVPKGHAPRGACE